MSKTSKARIIGGALLVVLTVYVVLGSSSLFAFLSQTGDFYLLLPLAILVVALLIVCMWYGFFKPSKQQTQDKEQS